jgi:hypothetical protein
MPKEAMLEYVVSGAEQALEFVKKNNDCNPFGRFLGFLTRLGSPEEKEEVIRLLSEQKKNKRDFMDKEIRQLWKNNREVLREWANMYEEASKPKPFLNKVAGIFRRFRG